MTDWFILLLSERWPLSALYSLWSGLLELSTDARAQPSSSPQVGGLGIDFVNVKFYVSCWVCSDSSTQLNNAKGTLMRSIGGAPICYWRTEHHTGNLIVGFKQKNHTENIRAWETVLLGQEPTSMLTWLVWRVYVMGVGWSRGED